MAKEWATQLENVDPHYVFWVVPIRRKTFTTPSQYSVKLWANTPYFGHRFKIGTEEFGRFWHKIKESD